AAWAHPLQPALLGEGAQEAPWGGAGDLPGDLSHAGPAAHRDAVRGVRGPSADVTPHGRHPLVVTPWSSLRRRHRSGAAERRLVLPLPFLSPSRSEKVVMRLVKPSMASSISARARAGSRERTASAILRLVGRTSA